MSITVSMVGNKSWKELDEEGAKLDFENMKYDKKSHWNIPNEGVGPP